MPKTFRAALAIIAAGALCYARIEGRDNSKKKLLRSPSRRLQNEETIASSTSQQQQTAKIYHVLSRKRGGTGNANTAEAEIIGGSAAIVQQYLFFASTIADVQYLCGATLVAPDILLTAAHCQDAFVSGAIVGAYLQGSNATPGAVQVEIVSRIVHPLFADFTSNDLMLMKINPAVTTIQPATLNLNPKLPGAGENLTIMGFGYTTDNGPLSDTLLQAHVSEIPAQQCQDIYGASIIDPLIHICVGNTNPPRSACYGDSGGPLVQTDGTVHVQFGVTSFGEQTCTAGPSVYSRLSGYTNFLQPTICELSDAPPDYLNCSSLTISSKDAAAPTLSPTLSPTPAPMTLQLKPTTTAESACTAEQNAYQLCMSTHLSSEERFACVMCVNNAFPSHRPEQFNNSFNLTCVTPKNCGCSVCSAEIASWINCDLNYTINCPVAPSAPAPPVSKTTVTLHPTLKPIGPTAQAPSPKPIVVAKPTPPPKTTSASHNPPTAVPSALKLQEQQPSCQSINQSCRTAHCCDGLVCSKNKICQVAIAQEKMCRSWFQNCRLDNQCCSGKCRNKRCK